MVCQIHRALIAGGHDGGQLLSSLDYMTRHKRVYERGVASRGTNMAVRMLLVLADLTIFFGCGRSSSPSEQGEKEGGETQGDALEHLRAAVLEAPRGGYGADHWHAGVSA
jgi:hypothetical protein